ncbi:MAG: DUF2189 domain-containing protein [Methylocella sp.]
MPKFHVIAGPNATPGYPIVRKIGPADLKDALAKGVDDFLAIPTTLVFLGLIYPIAGMCLAGYALPLLFPLMSGFALVGPFAAIGLYEISRRRERGLEVTWANAFDVRHSPSIPSLLALGLLLLAIFVCWRATAEALYVWLFGSMESVSYLGFLSDILTTSRGWTLIVLGNAIGCVFAAVVLSISVISFPLLLDRDVGLAVAVLTSLRAVRKNPVTMAIWGVIVAAVLAIGFLALFVGLAVAVPILAHASWHLYRKVVEPAAPV